MPSINKAIITTTTKAEISKGIKLKKTKTAEIPSATDDKKSTNIVIKNNEEKYMKALNKNNIKYCENLCRFIRGNERNIEIINLNFHELINIFFEEQLLP